MSFPVSFDEAELIASLLGRAATWSNNSWSDLDLAYTRSVAAQTGAVNMRDVELNALRGNWTTRSTDPSLALLRRANDPFCANGGADAFSDSGRLLCSAIPQEILYGMSGVPWFIQVRETWVDRIGSKIGSSTIGDGHIHSGGVSPPTVLLDGLFDSICRSAGLSPLSLRDGEGRQFAIDALVCGLGLAALALDGPESMVSRLLAHAVPGVTDSNFWTSIWAMAAGGPSAQEEIRNLRDAYVEAVDLMGYAPTVAILLRAAHEWVQIGSLPVKHEGLVKGSTGVLIVLHSALAVPGRASLDIFIERFNSLRSFRKLAPELEERRISRSVGHLLSIGELSRFELRKTVSFPNHRVPVGGVYAEIQTDIRRHVSGISDALVLAERSDVAAQMPISFLREALSEESAREVDLGELALRHPINQAMALANGVARVCLDSRDCTAFVGGVDVVGRESDTPNWVFALAYSYLHRITAEAGVELHYAVHAGEQYSSPLDGLRRIGELAFFDAPVSRVGHALALAEDAQTFSPGVFNAWDSLQSLCWADSIRPALRERLRPIGESLAAVVFSGAKPSWGEICKAYRSLFKYGEMSRIGLVPPTNSFHSEVFDFREVLRRSSVRHRNVSDAIILATSVDATFEGIYLNDTALVPSSLQTKVVAMLEVAFFECLPAVRDWVKKKGIVVESCPTSNVSLGRLDSYDKHPFAEFHNLGIAVSVNSDDPGLFGSLVEQEYLYLSESLLRKMPQVSVVDCLTTAATESARRAASGSTPERFAEQLARLREGRDS